MEVAIASAAFALVVVFIALIAMGKEKRDAERLTPGEEVVRERERHPDHPGFLPPSDEEFPPLGKPTVGIASGFLFGLGFCAAVCLFAFVIWKGVIQPELREATRELQQQQRRYR